MAKQRKSSMCIATLFSALVFAAACGEKLPAGGAHSQNAAGVTGNANRDRMSAILTTPTVLPASEQMARASTFVDPLNFRQHFLPEVLQALRMILNEELIDSVSIDVLNDIDFVDGSKYAASGVHSGPSFVLLGDDEAVHIYLNSGSFLFVANTVGIELGHAVQRQRLDNKAYDDLKREHPEVVSARAKAFQRALLLGMQKNGSLSVGLLAPNMEHWLTRLETYLGQEADYLADSEPLAVSFYLVWQAALRDEDLSVTAELRETGQLSFASASSLARKLLDADLGYFEDLRSSISSGQIAEIRTLLLTRFHDDLQTYPSFDLISGFLLP